MFITSSRLAYSYLSDKFTPDAEEFWVLALTSNKRLNAGRCLFRGTVDSCLVHPRDIFRFACLTNASSLIIAHNHPSLDPNPSLEDIRLTIQIFKAGRILQIPVIDHLIVTEVNYKSFADEGWKPFT